MHPILFTIGPLTVSSYGAMLAAAFLVSTWLAARAARRLPPESRAITAEQMMDFSCVSLVGGILGGRLFYLLLHWDLYLRTPQETLAIWHGGLVWYGGFLGGLMTGWLYVRRKRLAWLRVLDQFIPFGVLGHAIGRLGCFLNGCCYGKPTTNWYGVMFPGQPDKVLPTQLFEAGALVILAAILRSLQRPSILRHAGRVFGAYLASYGVLRFMLEFFRGDQTIWWPAPVVGPGAGLTLQQLISVGMVLVGSGLLLTSKRP